ncbi:MAG: hypothetical protein ACO1PM_24245 [Acidovorax sp.]
MPQREGLVIDPGDGAMVLRPSGRAWRKGLARADAQVQMAEFFKGTRERGNGYAWLSFSGFEFGGMPCWLSVGFHEGLLTMVLLGVGLPGAEEEDGWPTQKAIDNEIAFVRRALGKQLGRTFGHAPEAFPWGTAWSRFDPKGFMASAGVDYRG